MLYHGIVRNPAAEDPASRERPEAVWSADRSRVVSRARTINAYVLVRQMRYKLGAIAAYFSRDIATVALTGTINRAVRVRCEAGAKDRATH